MSAEIPQAIIVRRAILIAALAGPIASKAANPNLPTTPEEIAAEAQVASEAGAAIVDIRPRDAEGAPAADREVGRRTPG